MDQGLKISKCIEKNFDELKRVRRQLHQNPELSNREFWTQQFILDYLASVGIQNPSKIAETGVKGVIFAKGAKTLLFRADTDGLPITEKNQCGYRSKNEGVMHACGHDGHTAMVLLLAKILSEESKNLVNNIVFAFQPAEEAGGGAKRMIKEGILKDPAVDFVFASHVDSTIPIGKIGLLDGAQYANISDFSIFLEGKGGHAAHPERANDLIAIAAELIVRLHLIIPRESDPASPAVLSICKINGGAKNNVLPNNLSFEGTLRAHDSLLLDSLRKRICDAATSIETYHGIRARVVYTDSYPALINDSRVINYVKSTIGDDGIVLSKPSLGGEDFAFMVMEKPGFIFKLGIKGEREVSLHSETFDFDEKALLYGLEFFYRISMVDFSACKAI